MKYYINKKTGNIIGIENMREIIQPPTIQSINAGRLDYSYDVAYDMICPNKILGNGIVSYCITHEYLTLNYKRIKKEIALKKHPEFVQFRHKHLESESKKQNCTTLEVIQKQTF